MSASISYRRRATRRAGAPFAVTDRDMDMLTLVGLAGYVSTAQLASEFFPSADRCRRRLRQLFDGRLVTVTLASSTKPNLVSLTRPGLALVAKRRPELDGQVHLAGAIRLAGVDHHLTVVDARLYCAALGERRNQPLLQWSNAGGALAQELGLAACHLIPDGLAVFDRSFVVGIEADCCTEPRSTIASKLDRYASAIGAGTVNAVWFVVRGGAARSQGIAGLIAERGLGGRVRVLDHATVCERPVVDVGALSGLIRGDEAAS